MIDDTLTPRGPQFGANFITVTVNSDTGLPYQLMIYPDTRNALLKKNGLPMQFYFMPQRVYLAKKQTAPKDFDFGAMIFKGLMTTETTIGVTDAMTEGGTVEQGGGVCTFSTTFAIPESVITGAIALLKKQEYPRPQNFGLFSQLFRIDRDDPTPRLGIVPIVENDVTIEVPRLSSVGAALAPMYIDAQGSGKGSIEASSISSFLITLNQMAAGAIVGMLKQGKSPFTVHYNLKQMFYINACDIRVYVDVDKVFDQFSLAVSAGGFLGIDSAALSSNYQSCITSGAIQTEITMDGASIDADLKKMIDTQVEELQKQAFDLVKSEIFDWQPQADAPASTTRGLASGLFGGASVSLKSNHQRRGVKLNRSFTINSTVTKLDTVSGALNDLEPAITADLDKYLAIVEIGEYFKKKQIAATTSLNWSERAADGTNLADPVVSAQVEVSYPDYSQPLRADKSINFITQGQGFHYTPGAKNSRAPSELAVWTKDNAHDVINISFLRLDKQLANWKTDEVKVRKTIVFDGNDPRVELTNGQSTFSREEITSDPSPIITRDEVGYVFVKFVMLQKIPNDLFSVSLTCRIGDRSDTIPVTAANQNGVIWEIFSDRYLNATSATYSVSLTVAGPEFTDVPVEVKSAAPVTIPLPTGRNKYVNPVTIQLPAMTAAQSAQINQYIRAARST